MDLQDSSDDRRRTFLAAVQEREGRWDLVDPDAEIVRNGNTVGLEEDEAFALFRLLIYEHCIDPGRVLQAGFPELPHDA
jgi:hypothetical protein